VESAAPQGIVTGDGRVGVLTQVSGSRPDGRTFVDDQIMLFHVENGLVRSIDQYVGDPAAATAFWA